MNEEIGWSVGWGTEVNDSLPSWFSKLLLSAQAVENSTLVTAFVVVITVARQLLLRSISQTPTDNFWSIVSVVSWSSPSPSRSERNHRSFQRRLLTAVRGFFYSLVQQFTNWRRWRRIDENKIRIRSRLRARRSLLSLTMYFWLLTLGKFSDAYACLWCGDYESGISGHMFLGLRSNKLIIYWIN